jgi:hypothetical protein
MARAWAVLLLGLCAGAAMAQQGSSLPGRGVDVPVVRQLRASTAAASLAGAGLVAMPPCRVVDTRNPEGPSGGPAIQPAGGPDRSFSLIGGACAVPSGAQAVAANVTVVAAGAVGELTLYPADQGFPGTWTISFTGSRARANNAILMLSGDGAVRVRNSASGTAHMIIDVTAYFGDAVAGPTRYRNGRLHSPITPSVASTLRSIYGAGVAAGRRADAFVKVGDSISTGSDFLSSNADVHYQPGVTPSWEYCKNLSTFFDDLNPTCQHFLAEVPGSSNMNSTEQAKRLVDHITSWDRASQSTVVGISCPSLYPRMVTELSAVNPAYSVIMCGANDVGGIGPWASFAQVVDTYAEDVAALVDLSISSNVIPLVRSTPTQTGGNDRQALYVMSLLLRAVAQSRQVPYADMHSLFDTLAGYGLRDGVHFNSGGYNRAAWYDTTNLAYGAENQNLTVLTQLDRTLQVTYNGTAALDSAPAGYTGAGTSTSPLIVDELPFVDARTASASVFYQLSLASAATVRVMMADSRSANYDVVVDGGAVQLQMFDGSLSAGVHTIEIRPVTPGEYWLAISTH